MSDTTLLSHWSDIQTTLNHPKDPIVKGHTRASVPSFRDIMYNDLRSVGEPTESLAFLSMAIVNLTTQAGDCAE